jgi:ligand-binding SRPBCC domain-containing protein
MTRIHEFEQQVRLGVPAREAFAWHLRDGAFERLLPPGDDTRVLSRTGRLEDDSMRVELSVPVLGPIRQRWSIRHEDFVADRRFADVIERGPFRSWRHEHRIEPIDDVSCRLVDHIRFELPLGWIGSVGGLPIAMRRLVPMFRHRHAVTADDLTTHGSLALAPLRIELRGPWPEALALQHQAFLSTGGHDVAGPVQLAGAALPKTHVAPDATIERVEAHRLLVTAGGHGSSRVDVAGDGLVDPRAALRAIARLL